MRHDIAYLAGIIDGEGHFYAPITVNGRKEKHRYPAIVIVQNDRRLLDWIKARYGGYIHQLKNNPKHHRWELRGKKAVALALLVQPFLIVKDKQVLNCINAICEFCNKLQ